VPIPLITLSENAVLVHVGQLNSCGRTFNRARLYPVGDTQYEGTLGVQGEQWGTPLELVPQLTLEQGLTVDHILRGGD
jgi:hypothetical protein